MCYLLLAEGRPPVSSLRSDAPDLLGKKPVVQESAEDTGKDGRLTSSSSGPDPGLQELWTVTLLLRQSPSLGGPSSG